MKIKLAVFFLVISTSMLTLSVCMGNEYNPQTIDEYCAKLRDGKLVMMHNGSLMTADVTLPNGTQIKADGSVVKQDGETIVLKDGECLDKNGKAEVSKPQKP